MRIGRMFALALQKRGVLESVSRVVVTFRGSLAWTGKGHATDTASIYGLAGMQPRTFCAEKAGAVLLRARTDKRLDLLGSHEVAFDPDTDIDFDFDTPAGLHPNEMELRAIGPDGQSLLKRTYYSTGGGFVASHARLSRPASNDRVASGQDVPFPFSSAAELLALCDAHGAGIADILLLNEDAHRPRAETLARLDEVAVAMMDCVGRGLVTRGVLPGGLEVQRRAPDLWSRIQARRSNERESLFDYLNAYAMAVNEENAAGGQVVTAPTNGAAGILPAVMRHYCGDGEADGTIDTGRARTFLTVAGGIGLLYKMRASISGAEMGCQGEVGVACSMAAGGLAAVCGGDPPQMAASPPAAIEHATPTSPWQPISAPLMEARCL